MLFKIINGRRVEAKGAKGGQTPAGGPVPSCAPEGQANGFECLA